MTELNDPSLPHILVTDDDPGIRALLQEILEGAGYAIETAANGREALEKIGRRAPDLILLDVEMPHMTGWEVVKQIKADAVLQNLPVLMLTSLSQSQNKVQGLDLGADDYLTKPFNIGELLARVRGALRQTQRKLDANPLTRLPGNASIEREILNRIQTGQKFTILYADLNNFKAFNDRYGFIRGDHMIQETSRILLAARGPGDFLGHVGGDDFILVTTPERAEAACKKIISDFDAAAPVHYDPADRERGYVDIPDRHGHVTRFPFVGIAIAGVANTHRPLTSLGQISALGAEMKKVAKRSGFSSYAFDKRTT